MLKKQWAVLFSGWALEWGICLPLTAFAPGHLLFFLKKKLMLVGWLRGKVGTNETDCIYDQYMPDNYWCEKTKDHFLFLFRTKLLHFRDTKAHLDYFFELASSNVCSLRVHNFFLHSGIWYFSSWQESEPRREIITPIEFVGDFASD